jgi:hypothetical protein
MIPFSVCFNSEVARWFHRHRVAKGIAKNMAFIAFIPAT